MASEVKHVPIVGLNGANYPTWKVQCRMALIREGLWGIVAGTEEYPEEAEADKRAKFMARKDRALATIVLAVEPSLLYIVGDPVDPAAVWRKLSGQFQKKTWANKLSLRKKLFTMKLSDSGLMREHIKKMTEIFSELAVIAEPVSKEDQVVYLLAGLLESYDVSVTALESGSETVPPLENVTERLLREEQKIREKEAGADDSKRILMAKGYSGSRKKQFTCHFCKKPGHFKKDCRLLAQTQASDRKEKLKRPSHQPGRRERQPSQDAMLISHAFLARSKREWIVDSGATCHMSNDCTMFTEMKELNPSEKVTLGDGHDLEAVGEGTVRWKCSYRMETAEGVH